MKKTLPFIFHFFVIWETIAQHTLPCPTLNAFQNWSMLLLRYQADIDEKNVIPLFMYIYKRDSVLAQHIPCIAPLDVSYNLRVTSHFGLRHHPILKQNRAHQGVDLKVSGSFQFVYATAHGVVKQAEAVRGYGQMVVIEHPTGFETRYGHLQDVFVRAGQSVRIGQIVGLMGKTGLATGVHLHYEIRRKGVVLNPTPFLALLEAVIH